MTFEEFKNKFNFKKTCNLKKNCTLCDRFNRFLTCKPIVTGICYHYHLEGQDLTDRFVDQAHVCNRYLPYYGTRPLTLDEIELKKLEEKERDEIEKKEKELIKALCEDFKDADQITEEEKIGLMAEIARDEYGEEAFKEDALSQTEMKAVISGDDKLEQLVENEKKFREMVQ